MLNSKKLLYILPDVAYVAELLPTKKEHQFSIHAFRQINGDFIDDNTFIDDNVTKLIAKLEPEEYHLILPDFLFTNTIVEVKETSQSKIDAYLKDKLLPDLGITKDDYSIDTFNLTQLKDTTKIQLSALEKAVMAPVAQAAANHDITLTDISPLSWTTKAMISLEPSISVIQMGTRLYLAQHYIGIDQTTSWGIDEVEKIAETIKTLKGAEPSIQTLYLLTNELVEDKLKDNLSDTLPIQQLTKSADKENDMPGYVKQTIETGMRTLDIDDFPVPAFKLEKVAATASPTKPVPDEADDEDQDLDPDDADDTDEELPEPTAPMTPEPAATDEDDDDDEDDEDDEDSDDDKDEGEDSPGASPTPAAEKATETALVTATTIAAAKTTVAAAEQPAEAAEKPDLAGSATNQDKPMVQSAQPPKQIIKNKTNTGTMLKMIFITLAVLFATVAIGVGLGLGILKLSNRTPNNLDENPVVVTSPTPTPEPTATPTPEPELDPSEVSLLVVNATTIAGKAGDVKADLDEEDFQRVTAANAKGDYPAGANYVLMEEENAALISLIEELTGLEFEYSDQDNAEDPQGSYTAVVVFADEGNSQNTSETSATDEEETEVVAEE